MLLFVGIIDTIRAGLGFTATPVSDLSTLAESDGLDIDLAAFGVPTDLAKSALTSTAPVSRKLALQVGAVIHARDIIAGSIGTLPIATIGPNREQLTTGIGALTAQPEVGRARSVTMTRLVEDLMFDAVAYWEIVETGWQGYPRSVRRLAPDHVTANSDGTWSVARASGRVEVLSADRLIWFESAKGALRVEGARAIRVALLLDAAAATAADEPQMSGYFTPRGDADPLDESNDESYVDQWLAKWLTSRRQRTTGFVPAGLEYRQTTLNAKELQLAEARQHQVLELARVTGLEPEELGVPVTSRTYFNAQNKRQDRMDFTLAQYMVPVEDRLSMPDVAPAGYIRRFNRDAFLRTDTLTRYQSYEVGLRVGALAPNEIRELEDRPPIEKEPEPMPENVTPIMQIAAHKFSNDDQAKFVAAAGAVFKVDTERRTITGKALPFGEVATVYGMSYRFSRDSVTWADDVTRVKLLVDHDPGRAIGYATSIEAREDGLFVSFKVARGTEGDRALQMAEDHVLDGLSVGVYDMTTKPDGNGVHDVTASRLHEVSQTALPAFDNARVTGVAAHATHNHPKEGTTMPDTATPTTPATPAPEAAQFDVGPIVDAIAAGFANLPAREPVTPPADMARATVTEEPLYRFDGSIRGEYSLLDDIKAQHSSADASRRLEKFADEQAATTFAVATSDTGALNPNVNRPDLYVPNLHYSRPLWELCQNGSITDRTPFVVPKFKTATGLVDDHEEGVEPTAGAFQADSQTIDPSPMSGRMEINREVWDQGGNPKVDAIIWQEMTAEYYDSIERKIAETLDALTLTETNLAGATNGALQTALTSVFSALQFVRGGNRYTAFAADGSLFPALVSAVDTAGRPLFPVLGPSNADGQVSSAFDRVQIGAQSVRAAWALGTGNAAHSYLFVPSSVLTFASAPRKFNFEYRVSKIDLAIWGYAATAVLRDTDVKRIDHSTADV